jgi:hypothetical protein
LGAEMPGIDNPGGGPGIYGNPTSTPHDTKQQQSQGNPTMNNPSFDNAVKEFNALINRLPEFVGPTPKDGGVVFEKTYSFKSITMSYEDDPKGYLPASAFAMIDLDFHVRVLIAPTLNNQFVTVGHHYEIDVSGTISPSSDLGSLVGTSSVNLIANGNIISSTYLVPERTSTHSLIAEGSLYLGSASFIIPFTGHYSFQNYQISVNTNVIRDTGSGWVPIIFNRNTNLYIR